ncbi:MAG: putative aquaporin AqpM [Methanomassiliicoccales archaeon PtaU1.Bin124]|nr:MAG: putative aquaporin AqpM [Methanomassiliicoccales archaeon PtaU1.Bin124]
MNYSHHPQSIGGIILVSLKQNLVAEFLGTMFLVIAAIGSTILPFTFGVTAEMMFLVILINALAVALVLFALIETFGSISGAHFNPAVTLALYLNKEIGARKALMYVAVQFLGGFIGLLTVHIMFWDYHPDLLVISSNVKDGTQFFSEFLCTFILVGVIFGCVKGGSKHTGLSVAFLVGGMLITTVSTMFSNPAVTLSRMFTYAICGIAPMSGFLFIVAQLLGAGAAVVVFAKVLYPTKLKEKCDPFDCPSQRPIEIK